MFCAECGTRKGFIMNIIIVGCGKVGNKLAEMLSQEHEHDITVVDKNEKIINDTVNELDIMGVVGSGTNMDVLIEDGVKDADILIAVTGEDELNFLTCLMAKKLGDCQTISRIKKPEYSNAARLFQEDLGLAMIINPERAAANEMARVLRFPSAIQIDTFAKGRVEILNFRISGECALADMKISDIMPKLNGNILICGVESGKDAVIPDGEFVIRVGDRVSIVASIANGAEFLKRIGIKTNRVKDTIIVGGGATSYYLAERLIETGIKVKIIEKDEKRCESLCRLLPKATIVNGDGTEKSLICEEGLENSDAFVCLTNIDEENIILSLFAQSVTDGKVITKINRIKYDEVIEQLNLDTIVYPKNITAERIVRFVRAKKNSIGSNIETMHLILEGKAEALEFRIKENSPISNIPIEKLKLKKHILIACINRGGNIIIPKGKDIIQTDDTVLVVTGHVGFKDISDILE